MIAAFVMMTPLAACSTVRTGRMGSASAKSAEDVNIGISMLEQMLERWKIDGQNLKKELEKNGYNVTLQYADGKTDLQTSQIQNMANNGMDYVVIASIDGTSTGAAAEQVKDNGGNRDCI